MSTIANLIKVAEPTHILELIKPVLFVAKKVTLQKNIGTIPQNDMILVQHIINHSIWKTKDALQDIIDVLQYPVNLGMPPMQKHVTNSYQTNLTYLFL